MHIRCSCASRQLLPALLYLPPSLAVACTRSIRTSLYSKVCLRNLRFAQLSYLAFDTLRTRRPWRRNRILRHTGHAFRGVALGGANVHWTFAKSSPRPTELLGLR
jgi:hypothetical protein